MGTSNEETLRIFWFFVSWIVTSSESGLVTEVSRSPVSPLFWTTRKPAAMSLTGCGRYAPTTFRSGALSDEHPASVSPVVRARTPHEGRTAVHGASP